jgi:hypothetical protein
LLRSAKNKKAAHAGPLGQLKAIEEPLLRHIFELHEQGVTVSTFEVFVKASQLCPMFSAKHFIAWCSAVKRFVCTHLLVYRMGTHLLQRKPEEVEEEVKDYMCLMCSFLIGRHHDLHFVINMDRMPVYFAMNAKRSLEVIGKKTIHVRTSMNDNKLATVAMTITADGTVLPSMVIFKGKPNGRIAKTEFATYLAPHCYHCQENTWMDKAVMLAWVDDILRLYVKTAPDDVIPLLILDSYQYHMMGLVVQRIQELRVEVKHIPGGCTSLCQPIDISFNKPFKNHLRKLWITWMISKGVIHGTTSTPTRLIVATWVDQAMKHMMTQCVMVRNPRLKHDYKWLDKNDGGGGAYWGGGGIDLIINYHLMLIMVDLIINNYLILNQKIICHAFSLPSHCRHRPYLHPSCFSPQASRR